MILSIGEILADLAGEESDCGLRFSAYCGGAPFNLAVAAKRAGARVGFIGRVGDDAIGRFLSAEAKKADLDYLEIQTDADRNTTLAFVTLTDGERDFSFYRRGTADYFLNVEGVDFAKYKIVHLGSLMLSQSEGAARAKRVLENAKKSGCIISFDINFRKDLYVDFPSAKRAFKPFVEGADIIKFSEDELSDYTGIPDTEAAARSLMKKDRLLIVTCGSGGSRYYFNSLSGAVGTEKTEPVDTTGAGDAFFGTFLANIEREKLTGEAIEAALKAGNAAGAAATQFKGGVKL